LLNKKIIVRRVAGGYSKSLPNGNALGNDLCEKTT